MGSGLKHTVLILLNPMGALHLKTAMGEGVLFRAYSLVNQPLAKNIIAALLFFATLLSWGQPLIKGKKILLFFPKRVDSMSKNYTFCIYLHFFLCVCVSNILKCNVTSCLLIVSFICTTGPRFVIALTLNA